MTAAATHAREPLTALDAAWLHMDRPGNTADVVGLLALSGPLTVSALLRLLEERLLVHRRFRQRVHPELLGPGAWEDDPAFALSRHVILHRLPDGGAALRKLVGSVASEPLPHGGSPWVVHLASTGGRSSLVLKLQHAMGDGFALVGVLLSLCDEALSAGPSPAVPAPPAAVAAAARLAPPELAARSAAALARLAGLAPDPATPLTRPTSGVRRVAWTRGLPVAPLRAAARHAGAGLNDLLVAAVAGGLRRVLAREVAGVDRLSLRALVPVNLRRHFPGTAGEAPLGNRFGLVFLELPVGERAPLARLRAVQARMAELKASLDPVVTAGVLSGLGRCPPALEHVAADFFARRASLVLSSVPGPPVRLHLAGRRIDGAMFCVPHPATLGLGVSLLRYAGEVRLAVRADAAALEHPLALVRAVEQELAGFLAGGARASA
ncbi:WSD1 family O-acyltransferase [Anaeromyxobacter paludicola]|uniref:diacylglycerol O-acyltransferase n=1 Tax=Anaeromyxobacter paludicola TaxID=2918171 RepID=A0ABM7XA50_9BACT|nr:WSD1 family O-acyltransferase [Anaeromyxobacter paludicola]BDG08727.1 hypothetical protein AMPC_18400 [Anaeromyxobacter paludicola]